MVRFDSGKKAKSKVPFSSTPTPPASAPPVHSEPSSPFALFRCALNGRAASQRSGPISSRFVFSTSMPRCQSRYLSDERGGGACFG